MGLFLIPFEFVRKLTFHLDSDWLEITMNQFEGKNMLPAQLIAEESFYLQIKDLNKLYHQLKAIYEPEDGEKHGPVLEKAFDGCDRVLKSFSYLNLQENKKLYDGAHGS